MRQRTGSLLNKGYRKLHTMPSSKKSSAFRPGLSGMTFIALALGVVTGLFFGEMVAFLEAIGKAWIALLQMTVLPYLMLSMVAGLGRLSYHEALRLARKGGLSLLLLWAISLVVVSLFPLTFPDWESATFYSSSQAGARPEIDFLGLYIPANPFYALANNLVPAVVLFSVAIGIALIGVRNKEPLLNGMDIMIDALMRVANFIVRLTPIGVFAITASAAGTMSLAELQRMEVYIWGYLAFSLVMSLWVLPGLVIALTPLRYRDVIGSTRDVLVTAFATSSLFVMLPILMERCKAMIIRHAQDKQDAESAVEIIVPASYNFPHAGKLFTMTFVLFAGWYAGSPVAVSDYPLMMSSGIASLFANINLAVPFMLDIMRIPSDMFQLFVATSVILRHFGTLLSATFMIALTLLGAFSMSGLIRINAKRITRYLLITVALLASITVGLRVLFGLAFDNTYDKDEIIAGMQLLDNQVAEEVHLSPPATPPALPDDMDRLQAVLERGALRVCYWPDNLPFSYFNGAGDLVGFDIELVHHLAHDLKVSLVMVPAARRDITHELNRGYCDLGVGTLITPESALQAGYSLPYLYLTVAFLVRDHRRKDFRSIESIRQLKQLRVGIEHLPYYRDKVLRRLPRAEVVEVRSPRDYLENRADELDAMFMTAESASAWSLLYPQFTAVTPESVTIKSPIALPLPRGEEALADFLKFWIDLKESDSTLDRLYRYWVLGKQDRQRQPRWSVIRDVLHWVD
jgi:Na+/H+-dicarboxylate symporter/ABC-type amino acid transport substrate-binding protein